MNNLKALREKYDKSVVEIIDAIRISRQYYYDLEKGERRLNEEHLVKFADFYDVSTDYILGRTDIEKFSKDDFFIIADENRTSLDEMHEIEKDIKQRIKENILKVLEQ